MTNTTAGQTRSRVTRQALGEPFGRHQAVCLETQHFPDAPNRLGFPSPVLRPGEVYRSATEFNFATAAWSRPLDELDPALRNGFLSGNAL